jgi:hypothetical protein
VSELLEVGPSALPGDVRPIDSLSFLTDDFFGGSWYEPFGERRTDGVHLCRTAARPLVTRETRVA